MRTIVRRMLRRLMTERLQYVCWRWIRNGADALRHQLRSTPLDEIASGVVQSLKNQGIARARGVSDPKLLAELRTHAEVMLTQVWDETRQRPKSAVADHKGNRTGLGARENKEFLVVLTPKSFSHDSVFLRYALQPRFIAIANEYLGLRAQLRAVHLWLNFATDGEAASTQLWHRDGDDFMNLKIFTYLSDVDEHRGPFAFIPGTQPLGYRRIAPAQSDYGRTDDAQMQALVDRTQWAVCVGAAGDAIFADTCGYHKGVKPAIGYRLMLMVHYTSRAATSGSDIHVERFGAGALTPEQLAVIE